jgi:prevent-host-death family protein
VDFGDMMNTFGTYEAKENFSQLLERVALGECITITKRGKPIAMLVPAEEDAKADVKQVINDFIAYSKKQKRTLGKLNTRDMIQEGRRY